MVAALYPSSLASAAPLALSEFLVDSGSPLATGSTASDDATTNSTGSDDRFAALLHPLLVSDMSAGRSAGRSGDHEMFGAGSRRHAAGGSPSVSAGTSPIMASASFFDSAAGPMRSSGLSIGAPSRHGRHPSDADASNLSRSLTNGRSSRRGSNSGLSSSPVFATGFMGGQKPYTRPAPMTAIASQPTQHVYPAAPLSAPAHQTALPPWPATTAPSAGLTPILGPTKLELGAIDFAQMERELDQPSEPAFSSILDKSLPSTPAPTPAATVHFARGLTPPSRASPPAESAEDLAKDDPLATQLWKFYAKAKAKSTLPNAHRMENLSWRMGGMKIGQMVAEREQSAVPPSPQLRGRAAQSHGRLPFLCVRTP